MSAEYAEEPDALADLNPRLRGALALIGITRAHQLKHADGSSLWNDLLEASRLFPEEPCLTREEWEGYILPLLQAPAPSVPEEALPAPPAETCTNLKDGRPPVGDNLPARTRTLPKLAHRYSSTDPSDQAEHGMLPYRRRRKKGIRHQHILRTWIIALFVLLFYACALGIAAWLIHAFFYAGSREQTNLPVLHALLVGLLPFLLLGWTSRCSVCNIGIFSWKRYRRNRLSHQLPMLGCQLPTALHILLFLWFRCPSCGTPQELRRQ